MKKVIFALVAIMGLMLMACTPNKPVDPIDPIDPNPPQNDDLYQYKYEAMTEVNDYMTSVYDKDVLVQEDREDLIEIVNDFTTKLKTADDKSAVDNLKSKAKDEIDKISISLIRGQFLTLQEAYCKGYITKEDLTQIANFDGDASELSKYMEKSIRYSAFMLINEFYERDFLEYLDQVKVVQYNGEYNGNYVVGIDYVSATWEEFDSETNIMNMVLDGIELKFCYLPMVWIKELKQEAEPKGKFYSLQEAYDKGNLTVENLQDLKQNLRNGLRYFGVFSYLVIPQNVRQVMEETYDSQYDEKEYKAMIYGAYGYYNGTYVLEVAQSGVSYPGDVVEMNIGGVDLRFSRPIPVVFVQE